MNTEIDSLLAVDRPLVLRKLFFLCNADMQLTTDQQFKKLTKAVNYLPLFCLAKQRSGGASVACAGGIYDAAAKGGNALVDVGQSWLTLASGVNVRATLAAICDTGNLSATPYLSLTSGSTAACTADIWIWGLDIT